MNEKKVIKPGKIITINYILIKTNEVKLLNFTGLCISKNKMSIILKNIIKKQKIFLTIPVRSPLIVKMLVHKKYKKKYRLQKIKL